MLIQNLVELFNALFRIIHYCHLFYEVHLIPSSAYKNELERMIISYSLQLRKCTKNDIGSKKFCLKNKKNNITNIHKTNMRIKHDHHGAQNSV